MSETKKCTKCGEVKELAEFSPAKDRKPSVSSWCKKCLSNYGKDRRLADIDKARAIDRKCRIKNAEARRDYARAIKEKNREKYLDNRKWERDKLSDVYVLSKLAIPVAECPPELIELKREQLRIHRIIKQLKQEIQNV